MELTANKLAAGVLFFSLVLLARTEVLKNSSDKKVADEESDLTPPEILRKTLLSKGHPLLHPRHNDSHGTVIKFKLEVLTVTVDEQAGTLKGIMWYNMKWNDSRLTWSKEKTGIKVLRFHETEIWRPDLTVYNHADAESVGNHGSSVLIIVTSSGLVIWVPSVNIETPCKLDLRRWPYDTQRCKVKVGSWTYDGISVDVQLSDEKGVGTSYTSQVSEWKLVGSEATRNSRTYPCCPEPYIDVEVWLDIQREAPSLAVFFITPIIVITLVNAFVFLLPPSNELKITLQSINLLAICAFLMWLDNKLPSKGSTPVLVIMYALNLVLVGISLAIAMVIHNLSHSASELPSWLQWISPTIVARYLGLGHMVPGIPRMRIGGDDRVELQPDTSEAEGRSSSRAGATNSEWLLLAAIVDRVCFIVYVLVTIIILSVFL